MAMAAISTMVLEPSTNSTSMRGFMFRRLASSMYSVGRRVDVERIVLALAGGNDGVAEAGDEIDEFHGGGGLIACTQRIDDAKALGLSLQIGADGDVGLDVHHHQMLAVFHGGEADFGADCRLAGGIDHDVDLIRGADQLRILGDRRLAAIERGTEGAGRRSDGIAVLRRARQCAAPFWLRRY